MLGDDFDTPIMYQDLANYTMKPMNIPIGNMTGRYPSYLGGVQMHKQPDQDEVRLMHKKDNEGKSTFKKALIGIGICFALGFVPGINKKIKSLFKSSSSTSTSMSIQNIKTKISNGWQKFKSFFHKKP